MHGIIHTRAPAHLAHAQNHTSMENWNGEFFRQGRASAGLPDADLAHAQRMDRGGSKPGQALWEQLWSAWKSSDVPPVPVRNFAAGDTWAVPWEHMDRYRNLACPLATTYATAEHLACRLAGKDPELIAAYKIHAYLVHSDRRDALQDALAHAMRKHGEQLDGWWKPTVRYVLPKGSFTYTIRKLPFGIPDDAWPLMIEQAAGAWSDIARVWSVVRIAAFFEYDSPEHREVSRIAAVQREEIEREHYRQLKEKYEP